MKGGIIKDNILLHFRKVNCQLKLNLTYILIIAGKML